MRQPLLDRVTRARRDRQEFLPAPVRGINRRDNPLELRPDEALDLVNWIASPSRVRVRSGYGAHSLTVQALSSLMGYTNGSNVQLFAAGTSNVYNVTTSLPVVVFSCLSQYVYNFSYRVLRFLGPFYDLYQCFVSVISSFEVVFRDEYVIRKYLAIHYQESKLLLYIECANECCLFPFQYF